MTLVLGMLRKRNKLLEESTATTRSFAETMLTAMTSNSKEQAFLPSSCFLISILVFLLSKPNSQETGWQMRNVVCRVPAST